MEAQEVLDITREMIWVVIKISAPPMLVGLLVGLIISLFQALTQIQEQTLAFIPKILSIFAALIMFGSYIGRNLHEFTEIIIELITR